MQIKLVVVVVVDWRLRLRRLLRRNRKHFPCFRHRQSYRKMTNRRFGEEEIDLDARDVKRSSPVNSFSDGIMVGFL